MKKTVLLVALLIICLVPAVLGQVTSGSPTAPIGSTITAQEQATFDQILQPVLRIYNFVKYIVSIIAAFFLLYAGISYMTSGGDPRQRENAKNIALYVIIGLLVIWAAPLLVGLLL